MRIKLIAAQKMVLCNERIWMFTLKSGSDPLALLLNLINHMHRRKFCLELVSYLKKM